MKSKWIAAFVALVAGFGMGGSAGAQVVVSDDFSDLNDTSNPTWTHLDGYVGSGGQAWDASSGQYRMTTPNNGVQNLGFIGSYTGPSLSDAKVTVDVAGCFVDPIAQGAGFGVGARLNGLNGLGELTGYGYAYEPYAAGGAGEMVLYRIGPSINVTDLGAQQVTLDPNKDYTFILDVQGNQLHGQVFEVGGGLVAERTAIDSMYASGFAGLFGYSQNTVPPVDVTWDNFKVEVPEPGAGLIILLVTAGIFNRSASSRRTGRRNL